MSWTILIVDDSLTVRSQLRAVLEAKGARVIEAANGSEGLWRARENPIDLILADVHMPVMDGLRMIEELRELAEYRKTPIFILTSDAAGSRVEDGKKVGANAWILKPVKADLLWKAIDKAMFGRSIGPLSVSGPVANPVGTGNK